MAVAGYTLGLLNPDLNPLFYKSNFVTKTPPPKYNDCGGIIS
jgi:hypothetical protein